MDTSAGAATTSSQPNPYNWTFDSSRPAKPDPKVQDIPVSAIRRPLGRTRSNGKQGAQHYACAEQLRCMRTAACGCCRAAADGATLAVPWQVVLL
jgi:hypothetical protein